MLTLFTTAKPFEGRSNIIQHNALKSWKLLHPDVEIILFGNDSSGAEIANELGFRHEAFVERNNYGTRRPDYIFCRDGVTSVPELRGFWKRLALGDSQPRQ